MSHKVGLESVGRLLGLDVRAPRWELKQLIKEAVDLMEPDDEDLPLPADWKHLSVDQRAETVEALRRRYWISPRSPHRQEVDHTIGHLKQIVEEIGLFKTSDEVDEALLKMALRMIDRLEDVWTSEKGAPPPPSPSPPSSIPVTDDTEDRSMLTEIASEAYRLREENRKLQEVVTGGLVAGTRVRFLRNIRYRSGEGVVRGELGTVTKVPGDTQGTVEVEVDSGLVLDAYPGRDICSESLLEEEIKESPKSKKAKEDDNPLADFWDRMEQDPSPYAVYRFHRRSETEMQERSGAFYELMRTRRSCRAFSSERVPLNVLKNCIKAAGTAPSGANLQPWKFVVVQDPAARSKLREVIERHEEENYRHRLKEVWRKDIRALDPQAILVQGQPWKKPYIEQAAFVVCIFKQVFRVVQGGGRLPVYYPEQSVGISVGMFLSACHNAGMATLASYPMGAEAEIRDLLGRPGNEKLCLVVPVGYPAPGCTVINHPRKPLEEICIVK